MLLLRESEPWFSGDYWYYPGPKHITILLELQVGGFFLSSVGEAR